MGPELGIKRADNALVAGKQVGDVLRGQMVNGEQIAVRRSFSRRMPLHGICAMVVAREVSGHKRAVAELIRHQVVTRQQRFKAVIMAFDATKILSSSIRPNWHRRQQASPRDVRIGIERTRHHAADEQRKSLNVR